MRRRTPLVAENWKLILQVFAWISLAAVLVNLFASWRTEERDPRPLSRSVGGREDDSVRIDAHLGADRVEPGSKVECWFLVHNMSDKEITGVRVIGWDARGLSKPAEFKPDREGSIGPGHVMFFRPEPQVVALSGPPRFTVAAEIEWRSGKTIRREVISLGRVSITEGTPPRVFAVTRTYVALLRDLAMPIGLLLITWLFSTHQRDAEADRASLNLMLAKSHQDMERYYGPVGTSARNAARFADKASPRRPPLLDELTYWVLIFRKRTRQMFQKIGGYYLPTRLAEEIVVNAQTLFLELLLAHVDPLEFASAKDQLNVYTEYYVFRKQALNHSDVKKVRAGLLNWLKTDANGMSRAFALLKILEEVLMYDINLIYEFWYDEKPPQRPELTAEVALLRTGTPQMSKLADQYLEYRREMEDRPW